MKQTVLGAKIITQSQQREEFKMTRSDFLNEQLDYIYLTEDIEKAVKKIDIKKFKEAAKSQNIKKALVALKNTPNIDIKSIKSIGEKRIKNFKKYYMEAETALVKAPEDIKVPYSSLYAVLKSIGENVTEVGKSFGRMAAKLLTYFYKYGGTIAWRGFRTVLPLAILALLFGHIAAVGAIVSLGIPAAKLVFSIGLFFVIFKLIVKMSPRAT
jgi:hypothetical protein